MDGPTIRRISAGLVCASLVISLGACSSSTAGSSAAAGDKNTLVLGMNSDIQGWDPSIQPGFQGWAGEAIWDKLVFCNAQGEPVEGLAKTWEISEDRKSFTAHLRSGVKFSDGSEFTSEDVKSSFKYYATHSSSTGDYEGMTIDTPDDLTVRINWPDSQPVIESKICNVAISSTELLDSGQVNDTPIGTGPYVLDSGKTTRGSVYTFTKNKDYWNSDLYPYENLEIKVIEDSTAAISALQAGQIDGTLINMSDIKQVEGFGAKVEQFEGITTRLLLTDHLGEKIPALGDVRVRQAINMVFDKEAMVKSLFGGYGEPTAQVFRKGTAAYIENLKDPYPFNVEKAQKLMKEAGYEDGFEIELPTMTGQGLEELIPYVVQQLAKINITVKQVPLSGANAISDLLSGTYPVVFWRLGNLGNAKQQVQVEMDSSGYWNLEHQKDDYVDSRWKELATADDATAKKLLQEINQYVIDQAWFAPMAYTGNFYAHSKSVSIPTQSDVEALAPKLRDFQKN
ncbi:ABC transporter substrate-binding protein [Bifidobacterium sp. SO4]|uniref:ABC transporter substrate-binding protein n=1 Tax=Bifidobacterium sp. SO4 TaxID=2809030 RepID=UPI001BDC0BCA|nr:ABC transporter substrate-binding protein [Bifidobacterium sp. SO4]MBT1170614.1 hypothetical protein [Bifidobacterium sp. SO4]